MSMYLLTVIVHYHEHIDCWLLQLYFRKQQTCNLPMLPVPCHPCHDCKKDIPGMEQTSMTSWDHFANLQRRNPQRPEWTDKFEVSVQGGFDRLNVGGMGALPVGLGITVLQAFPCSFQKWKWITFLKDPWRIFPRLNASFRWSSSDNFQLSFEAKAWPWNGLTSWESRELEAADGQIGCMVRGCY